MPDDVTGEELDVDARVELRTLPKDLAAKVSRHLVMAGRLAEEDPEQAYRHARAARRLASRVGIVREAAGIAAYHAGEWAEALAELRAARRLGAGDDSYLPVMADCERGLGRPERALDVIKSPEAGKLDPMGRVELRIVESGVRRDMGQYDAAVVTLQIPELRDRRLRPWSMRLFYAYADALVEAGRADEASDWFARAAAADRDGDTDAAERYAEIEGLHILDTEEDEDEDEEVGAAVAEDRAADAVSAGGDDAAAAAVGAGEGGDQEAGTADAAAGDDGAAGAVSADADDAAAAAVGAGEGEGVGAGTGDGAVVGEDGAADAVSGDADDAAVGAGEGEDGEAGDDDGAALGDDGVAGAAGAAAGEGEGEGAETAGTRGGAGEPAAATDIAFKAAEPETLETPDEDAPEAPMLFLEPKPADEERPPHGE